MVRHGESAWNAENRFCGWHDADLAESGIAEAKLASQVSIKTNHDKCISILKLLKYFLQWPITVALRFMRIRVICM